MNNLDTYQHHKPWHVSDATEIAFNAGEIQRRSNRARQHGSPSGFFSIVRRIELTATAARCRQTTCICYQSFCQSTTSGMSPNGRVHTSLQHWTNNDNKDEACLAATRYRPRQDRWTLRVMGFGALRTAQQMSLEGGGYCPQRLGYFLLTKLPCSYPPLPAPPHQANSASERMSARANEPRTIRVFVNQRRTADTINRASHSIQSFPTRSQERGRSPVKFRKARLVDFYKRKRATSLTGSCEDRRK